MRNADRPQIRALSFAAALTFALAPIAKAQSGSRPAVLNGTAFLLPGIASPSRIIAGVRETSESGITGLLSGQAERAPLPISKSVSAGPRAVGSGSAAIGLPPAQATKQRIAGDAATGLTAGILAVIDGRLQPLSEVAVPVDEEGTRAMIARAGNATAIIVYYALVTS